MKTTVGGVAFVLAAAAVCLMSQPARASEKALLRYKWTAGSEETFRLLLDGVAAFANVHRWKGRREDGWSRNRPKRVSIHKEQLSRSRTLSVDEEGTAVVSGRVKTLVSLRETDGSPEEKGEGKWVGECKAEVSSTGEMRLLDPEAWKTFFREKVRAPRLVLPLLPRLPEGEVGVGDTWKGSGKIVHLLFPLPDLEYEITYRLVRFEEVCGRRCAVIRSEARIERDRLLGEWKARRKGGERRAGVSALRVVLRGEFLFDLEAGGLLRGRSVRCSFYRQAAESRDGEKGWGHEEDVTSFVSMSSELVARQKSE